MGINIKPIIKLFGSSKSCVKNFSTKPESLFGLATFSPVSVDTFHLAARNHISVDEVKKLFADGKIEGGYLRDEIMRIKVKMFFDSLTSIKTFKKWLHSVSLNKNLKTSDYDEITGFMNLHNGKYLDIWRGLSSTDEIPNIQKLVLFVRSINDKLNLYKNLSQLQWETCIEGIINKPEYVIRALMEYKYDSRRINNAITSMSGSQRHRSKLLRLKSFLIVRA